MLILLPAPRRHVTLCLSLLPAPRGHATLELSLLPAPRRHAMKTGSSTSGKAGVSTICSAIRRRTLLSGMCATSTSEMTAICSTVLLDSVLAHEKRHLEDRLLHYLRKLLEGSLLTPPEEFVCLAHLSTRPGIDNSMMLPNSTCSTLFFSRRPSTPSRVVSAGGT